MGRSAMRMNQPARGRSPVGDVGPRAQALFTAFAAHVAGRVAAAFTPSSRPSSAGARVTPSSLAVRDSRIVNCGCHASFGWLAHFDASGERLHGPIDPDEDVDVALFGHRIPSSGRDDARTSPARGLPRHRPRLHASERARRGALTPAGSASAPRAPAPHPSPGTRPASVRRGSRRSRRCAARDASRAAHARPAVR